jgi:phospholipid N-methyltransferase
MSDTITFIKNFIRHPTQVGAISPSSPSLVKTMVDWIDWENAKGVVEFGPGTGVFTEAIAARLSNDARFIAIEQSAELAETTRKRVPGVNVIQDSATKVAELCRQSSMESVDAIVCGLPWAAFPESLTDEIMDAMFSVLRPGGQFATFAYWQGVILPAGMRFSRRLNRTFRSVEKSPTAWRNLPPAFVYRCIR